MKTWIGSAPSASSHCFCCELFALAEFQLSFQLNFDTVNVEMRSMSRHCTSTISGDLSDPFASAIRCGDTAQVNTILELLSPSPSDVRALVNRVLDDGSTPLNVAIAFRHFDVARILMDCGSNVELPDSFRLDGCRRQPIHYACSAGSLELVKTFVEDFDVDVDEPDDGNATPIHHAAAAGHIGNLLSLSINLSYATTLGRAYDEGVASPLSVQGHVICCNGRKSYSSSGGVGYSC